MEKTKAKILIVDDNKTNLELAKTLIEDEGYYAVCANNAAEALRKLKRDVFDLVITDLLMPPGKDGLELTEEIKKHYPKTEVIVITAYGEIEKAVKAIKMGAHDFIQRPIDNQIFLHKIASALEKKTLVTELEKIKRVFKDEIENQYKIIGNSAATRRLLEKIKIIASTDSIVLIEGESGTGKELVARTLHNLSSRKNNNFITVNCGAIPESLIESELFGYKKGSFTGAYADKVGLLEEANNGSIFLDEVGDLPLSFQVKLLRFIQEGEIKPIGENKSIKVNVRIIAATNKDLKKLVAEGSFREDLYYRLNVIPIEILPLRQRKEDIPILANYFLAKYTEKYKKNINGFTEMGMAALIKHQWKGNVRELENALERAVILCSSDKIDVSHLPMEVTHEFNPDEKVVLPYKQAKEIFDREYITNLLKFTKGNVKKAATLAQKHRTDLYDMIRKYNIDNDAFR